VQQVNLSEMALGMNCHKKMYQIVQNGDGLSVTIFGDVLSQKYWGHLIQGMDHPGDGSSRGRFVLGMDRLGKDRKGIPLGQPYSWLHPLLQLPSNWLIVVLCLVSLRQPYSWVQPRYGYLPVG
jgi:hypothetical protein